MRKLREGNKVSLRTIGSGIKYVFLFSALLMLGGLVPTAALVAKRNELEGKQKILGAIWKEAGDDIDMSKVTTLEGDTAAKLGAIKALDLELNSLSDELKALDEVEGIKAKFDERSKWLNDPANGGMRHPEGDGNSGPKGDGEGKTLAKMWIETKAHEQLMSGVQGAIAEVDYDIKAVFRTGAGWATEAIRMPRVELDPQRPIAVVDMIPQLPTRQDTIRYMEETTFTSTNAVETAESTATTASDLIGEAALALTERTQAVEWLPVFLPITMQQLEDVDGAEEYVNRRLTYMIRARLDSQILVGDGVTPNILGTNNVTGIQTQAKGTDPTPDAIFKGMQSIRSSGFAEPSVVFIHPNDWQDIRLLRTADGHYLFGSPMDSGSDRVWGIPVVQTTAATENTVTLGDYRNFASLFTRMGVRLTASDSHAFYFTRGMLAIKAEMRISMVHFRPEAFANITGV